MKKIKKNELSILELGINNALRWDNINNVKVKLDYLNENEIVFNTTKIKHIPKTVFDIIISYNYFISSIEIIDSHDNKKVLNPLNLTNTLNTKQDYKETKLILSHI